MLGNHFQIMYPSQTISENSTIYKLCFYAIERGIKGRTRHASVTPNRIEKKNLINSIQAHLNECSYLWSKAATPSKTLHKKFEKLHKTRCLPMRDPLCHPLFRKNIIYAFYSSRYGTTTGSLFGILQTFFVGNLHK